MGVPAWTDPCFPAASQLQSPELGNSQAGMGLSLLLPSKQDLGLSPATAPAVNGQGKPGWAGIPGSVCRFPEIPAMLWDARSSARLFPAAAASFRPPVLQPRGFWPGGAPGCCRADVPTPQSCPLRPPKLPARISGSRDSKWKKQLGAVVSLESKISWLPVQFGRGGVVPWLIPRGIRDNHPDPAPAPGQWFVSGAIFLPGTEIKGRTGWTERAEGAAGAGNHCSSQLIDRLIIIAVVREMRWSFSRALWESRNNRSNIPTDPSLGMRVRGE